ncbi:hypothetical protein IP79_00005, partial [Porphyrobacter sp. AAP60]
MSHEVRFEDWLRPARRRAMGDVVLVGSPLVLVFAALGWTLGGVILAAGALGVGAIVLGWTATRRANRLDRDWLSRRLNAREAQLEDSAALLFAETDLAPVERLQANRIAARIMAIDPASLADSWSWRRIAVAL